MDAIEANYVEQSINYIVQDAHDLEALKVRLEATPEPDEALRLFNEYLTARKAKFEPLGQAITALSTNIMVRIARRLS